MTLPAKSSVETSTNARHGKSNSRVIPVIPKQLIRKPKPQAPQSSDDKAPTITSTDPAEIPSNASTIAEVGSAPSSANLEQSQAPTAPSPGRQARDGVQGIVQGTVQGTQELSPGSGTDKVLSAITPQSEYSSVAVNGVNGHSHTADSDAGVSNGHHPGGRPPGKLSKGTVELPPPFYPTAYSKSAGVMSPGAGAEPRERRSFVFGGQTDSSAPSPAPPASADSWTSSAAPTNDGVVGTPASTVNGFAKPPQSSTPISNQSFTTNGIPPDGARPHLPPVFVPPLPPQSFQQGVHPQHQRHWTGSRNIQSPRSGSISSIPPEPPYSAGGPAFPAGAFPNFYQGYGPNDSAVSLQRGMPYQQAPPFSPTRPASFQDSRVAPAVDPDMSSLYALRSYTMTLFTEQTRTDTILNVPSPTGENTRIEAHAIFLLRSPKLRAILSDLSSNGAHGHYAKTVVDVPVEAVLGEPNAFHAALRFLYGGPAIRREHLPGNLKSPKHVLDWVLSYAAAGWYLEMPEIATAGLALATELMLVDNVDVALTFALKPADSDLHLANGNPPLSPLHAPRLKYFPYAADFLHSTTRFILFIITSNFDLDPTAPQLPHLTRIPERLTTPSSAAGFTSSSSHSSRPSASNPRLQGLQLGDFQPHTSANRTLSSALLSLPFLVLQSIFADRFILERLSPGAREGQLRALVHERERRRTQALEVLARLPDDERRRSDLAAANATLHFVEEVIVANGEPRLVGHALPSQDTAPVDGS